MKLVLFLYFIQIYKYQESRGLWVNLLACFRIFWSVFFFLKNLLINNGIYMIIYTVSHIIKYEFYHINARLHLILFNLGDSNFAKLTLRHSIFLFGKKSNLDIQSPHYFLTRKVNRMTCPILKFLHKQNVFFTVLL